MENLNAEQVKKALECCTRGRKSKEDRPCLDCPYNECNLVGGTSERQTTGTCQGWLMKDALALINSQEQRIKELAEENERLRASSIDYRNIPYIKAEAKADTVSKMQERLHARKVSYGNITFRVVPIDDIDQIAKEMLEGENSVQRCKVEIENRKEVRECACGARFSAFVADKTDVMCAKCKHERGKTANED